MKLQVDIICPRCSRRIRQAVGDMRPGRSRDCPGCDTRFQFTGDDGRKTQRALDDLERSVKRLSRRLRF